MSRERFIARSRTLKADAITRVLDEQLRAAGKDPQRAAKYVRSLSDAAWAELERASKQRRASYATREHIITEYEIRERFADQFTGVANG